MTYIPSAFPRSLVVSVLPVPAGPGVTECRDKKNSNKPIGIEKYNQLRKKVSTNTHDFSTGGKEKHITYIRV